MSRSWVFHWHKTFREDIQLPLIDAPRCGSPYSVCLPGNILKVRQMVEADRRVTLGRISYLLDLLMGSVQAIMCKDLKVQWVTTRFVPRILTDEQLATQKDTCQCNLSRIPRCWRLSLLVMKHGSHVLSLNPSRAAPNGCQQTTPDHARAAPPTLPGRQ